MALVAWGDTMAVRGVAHDGYVNYRGIVPLRQGYGGLTLELPGNDIGGGDCSL